MEIIKRLPKKRKQIKAALFDFDGTISTLRYGWESVMEPLMLEMITGGGPADDELVSEVRDYIDQSTGIQTYYQMLWLAETVKSIFPVPDSPAGEILTNARQAEAVNRALVSLRAAYDALLSGCTPDIVLTEAEGAMSALGELSGRTVREDVTNRIFERFCVGK